MGQYANLQQEAKEAREQRLFHRRRLLQGVRGLVRQFHRPRWLAARSLGLAALPGFLVCLGAHAAGFSFWGPSPAVGILALWLGYNALMRRGAERLGRAVDFWLCFEEGIAADEEAEARRSRGLVGALEDRFTPEKVQSVRRSIEQGWRSGSASSPAGGLFVLILLGCVSGGLWLVWQIIETAPGLLAAMIVDESTPRRHPEAERRVEFTEKWRREALVACGVYFWALAAVALIFGSVLWFGVQVTRGHARSRPEGRDQAEATQTRVRPSCPRARTMSRIFPLAGPLGRLTEVCHPKMFRHDVLNRPGGSCLFHLIHRVPGWEVSARYWDKSRFCLLDCKNLTRW